MVRRIATSPCETVLSLSLNQEPKNLFVNDTPFMIRLRAHFLVSINHRQPVRQDMWPPTPIYERIPLVWFLLGLLFIATGLYLGFEFSLSFWYLMIGCFCCAYSVAMFVLRPRERPRAPAATRLSPEFISAESGHTEPAHAISNNDHVPVMEQSGSE